MAKTTQLKKKNIEYSPQVQVLYTDTLVRFSLGTMVSKMEFATIREDKNDDLLEVNVVIQLPTGNLVGIVSQMYEQINDKNVRKSMIEDLKNYIEFLDTEN
ncbi:hypothetical protein QOK77_11840 [Moraxella osloensis]|jgi:hypothetical protein|nr:hypothetical protein [Moraxella osloensis]MDK1671248.1 hypothetical protein [Moraxella osloensis]